MRIHNVSAMINIMNARRAHVHAHTRLYARTRQPRRVQWCCDTHLAPRRRRGGRRGGRYRCLWRSCHRQPFTVPLCRNRYQLQEHISYNGPAIDRLLASPWEGLYRSCRLSDPQYIRYDNTLVIVVQVSSTVINSTLVLVVLSAIITTHQ